MKLSVRNILRNIFAIISMALFGFVVFLTISGTHAYAVQSDSMLPTLSRGDVVFVRPVSFDELRDGDVISAKLPASGTVFTHRILRVDSENRQVYTRGDHNMSDDPMPTAEDKIIGRLWFSVPYVGFLSLYLTNRMVLYVALGIALVLILLRVVLSMRKKTNG